MGCSAVIPSSSIIHQNGSFSYLHPISPKSLSSSISNSVSFQAACNYKHPKPIKISGKSLISSIPRSRFYLSVVCCSSPKSTLPKISMNKVAVLVTGSVLLIGCLCSRPVRTFLGFRTSLSERIEGKGKKEVDEVGSNWDRFLEKNPRDVDALKTALYGKMRRGKNAEAVKYVESLIELEPDEVEWRLLQALCYEMMGHYSTAKRLFREILKGRPLLVKALHGLAMVMHKNNEGPAIYEMLNNALEIARREKRVTEERNIRILIAQMHVVKGELEEGLAKFQSLIDDNPRDFRPYLCQGIILSLLNRKEEAEQQFDTYRSLVPEEFPERRYLDDVALEAKTKSRERLQKDFEAQYSPSRPQQTENVP